VVEIGSGGAGFLAGGSASCGALLVLAGVSKIYRGARAAAGDTAVRRALRVPLRRWRRAEPAIGGLECAVGVAVVAYPVAGGAAMAMLGAAFCALLGYARVKRVPGGCGCVEWRTPPRPAAQRVSWPEIVRSAMLFGAGLAAAVLRPGGPGSVSPAWFGAGLLVGGTVLTLLSFTPLRTPVCHRPVWRPARATLRALTGHAVFAAMAGAAGPFGPVTRHRRTGCTEEFWFAAAQPVSDVRGEARAVVFRVRYTSPGGSLAVQASITKESYEIAGADRVGVRTRHSRVRRELVGPGVHGEHAVQPGPCPEHVI
jgi:hypothetical protein